MLKLEYLKEQLGGEAEFGAHVGKPFNEMQVKAKIDRGLRDALLETKPHELKDKIAEPDFAKSVAPNTWIRGAA